MFLTRFELDPQRREVGRWLAAPNTLHAALMRAVDPREGERMLWRVDPHDSGAELYVVTVREFDPAPVISSATSQGAGAWRSQDMSPLLDRLAVGQRWVFRLTASPTIALSQARRADGSRDRGKVIPLVKREDQRAWLTTKAVEGGFTVDSERGAGFEVVEQRRWVFSRRPDSDRSGGARVTLTTATFEGVLVVDDAVRLGAALTNGIGRAKGYGCGLLTLARP